MLVNGDICQKRYTGTIQKLINHIKRRVITASTTVYINNAVHRTRMGGTYVFEGFRRVVRNFKRNGRPACTTVIGNTRSIGCVIGIRNLKGMSSSIIYENVFVSSEKVQCRI